jgi:hypothetical protein
MSFNNRTVRMFSLTSTMSANSREYQLKAIDAEIKSLEESIRALRHRRNALAPISSLPTEVITSIFSILRSSGPTLLASGKRDHLAWLRVTHVCHQWREISLNNPLFWSHIDFNNLTLAGVTEMLVRAKEAPLHLEANVTGHQQDDARFSAFKEVLQSRVSYICHLHISADPVLLCTTLERLVSPAPTLEYLSLSMGANYRLRTPSRAPIPDTLFGGTTPRLSCLKLYQCDISWKSPLLKGLRHLEIRSPSERVRPSLADWLGALDEMPRLKELILHSASPIAPPFPLDVERTVSLSFLTDLDISASAGDCALALSHLILPALTQLCIEAESVLLDGGDVLKLLPYVTRHSHGPQDTQPLQNVAIRGKREGMEIYAWSDINGDASDYPFFLVAIVSAPRVAFSVTCHGRWSIDAHTELLGAAMAAFPLDNLMKLTTELDHVRLDEAFWRSHAPRWPLLECIQLAPFAVHGFTQMILQDDGGHENPLLPLLTSLALPRSALTMPRVLHLCDALMKRVEQGVPVEELDLHTCNATRHAIRLLSEIVASVWSPGALYLHTFLPDADFEDDSHGFFESEPYRSDDDEEEEEEEEEEEWEMDDEEDYLVTWVT